MAIISFWSNTTKQVGQTMSAVAIASMMAVEHNYKILLLTTKSNDNTLELCFGSDKTKSVSKLFSKTPTVAIDNGIEGLYKAANSGRLTPEAIPNYTKTIFKNRLEVLYAYNKKENATDSEQYRRIKEKYKDIIQTANKYYDMILIDLEKGIEDDISNQILSISDIIIVNIEQKLNMINEFMKNKSEESILKDNNIMLNIGRFDNSSKYTLKNISRYIGIKKDIFDIPYNTLFMEASSEEGVADFFLRILKVSEMDINSTFVKDVKEAKDKIIYKLQELQMRI